MGNKKGLLKSILPWLIVLAALSVAIPFFNQSESSEIRYDKFIKIVQDEKAQNLRQVVIKIPGLFRIIQHENIRTSHHLRTSCGHTAEQQRSGRRAQSFRENRPRGTVLQSLYQSLYRLMPCIEGL